MSLTEIFQVVRHDDFRACLNRGGKNVAVVGVGQCQGCDPFFVFSDEAITNGTVHQASGSCQTLGRKPRVIPEYVTKPFVVNGLCPSRPYETRLGDPDKQVTQWSRIKDVRIIDSRDRLIHQ